MSFISSRKAEALLHQMQHTGRGRSGGVRSGFSVNTLYLLKKAGHLRGELDLLAIEKDIRRQAWIEKLPEDIVNNKDAFHDVLRHLSLKTYSAGTVLHEAGSPVDTMYVVVSGSLVTVHIITDEETGEEDEHIFKRLRVGEVAGKEFLDLMEDWETTLKVDADDTEVLEISRELYNDAILPHEERAVTERAAFLKHVPPFSRWGEDERVNMARLLRVEHYPSNTTIMKQGGVPKKFYIIFQGYCRILKEIAVPCRSLTILRAPLDLTTLSHSSADPNPITVKRRPVTADLEGGRSRNFGSTSWRCPMWRERMPRPHRWDLMESKMLHERAFTVSTPSKTNARADAEPPLSARSTSRANLSLRSRSTVHTPRKSELTTPRTPWSARTPMSARTPRGALPTDSKHFDAASSWMTLRSPGHAATQTKSRVVHAYHGDELEGSKKVIIELREVWRGQFFGEQGIINKSVNSASVATCSAVQLLALSKLDFCRLQQDTGEGARELNEATEKLGYRNETDDIVEAMKDEFHWMNFRQDISSDSIFGTGFAARALASGTTGWAEVDAPLAP